MNKYEKLIYRNELGQQIEFSLFSPFHIISSQGLYGLNNEIITTRGINQDGLTVSRFNTESRNIVITCAIKSDVINNKRDALIAINPKLKGNLIYSFKNDIRYIECIVEKSPDFSSDRISKFQISLICPNPYWKNNLIVGDQIATWIGGWKFKFKLPFRFKQKGESKKDIYNSGHVETPVEVIFKGPALNPCILNNTTGEFIKVIRELTSDDTLYITTEYGNKKVEIERNGIRTNAFHYIDLDSTFFQLQVGDNMIEYTTDNNLEPQSVEIRYRDRYIGV